MKILKYINQGLVCFWWRKNKILDRNLGFVKQGGATALVTVLIISVSSLIMAYGATMLGLGELGMSCTVQEGEKAMYGIESCLDETLIKLKRDTPYSGGNLVIGAYSCIININGTGNPYYISVESNAGDYTKKIEVEAEFNGLVPYLNSWTEVSP